MKKTLAILLALLAAASISLAACDTNDKTPIGGDPDDDIEHVDDSNDENADTNGNGTDENTDAQGPSTNTNPTTGYVDKNDVVYAGVDLNLRNTDYSTSDSSYVKTVPFGTKLNRIASDGVWDKVKLDGEDTVYYVVHALVSGNNNSVFTELDEPVAITFSETTQNKIMFFNFPFESEDDDYYWENVVLASGLTHANLSAGYSLKKIAYNNNWVKVEFVGTITVGSSKRTLTEDAPGVYYIKNLAFSRGDIVDPTYSSGSGQTPGGQG